MDPVAALVQRSAPQRSAHWSRFRCRVSRFRSNIHLMICILSLPVPKHKASKIMNAGYINGFDGIPNYKDLSTKYNYTGILCDVAVWQICVNTKL